jgi:hypothetical protein
MSLKIKRKSVSEDVADEFFVARRTAYPDPKTLPSGADGQSQESALIRFVHPDKSFFGSSVVNDLLTQTGGPWGHSLHLSSVTARWLIVKSVLSK